MKKAWKPVSYTHLDVYKRQVCEKELPGFLFFPDVSTAVIPTCHQQIFLHYRGCHITEMCIRDRHYVVNEIILSPFYGLTEILFVVVSLALYCCDSYHTNDIVCRASTEMCIRDRLYRKYGSHREIHR